MTFRQCSRKQITLLLKETSQILYLLSVNKGTLSGGAGNTQEIDELISILENGQWYTLEEVITKAKLPKIKGSKIIRFLANYNFIDLDREHKRIRVAPSLMKFLKENETH